MGTVRIFPKLGGTYLNCSDMKELSEIALRIGGESNEN